MESVSKENHYIQKQLFYVILEMSLVMTAFIIMDWFAVAFVGPILMVLMLGLFFAVFVNYCRKWKEGNWMFSVSLFAMIFSLAAGISGYTASLWHEFAMRLLLLVTIVVAGWLSDRFLYAPHWLGRLVGSVIMAGGMPLYIFMIANVDLELLFGSAWCLSDDFIPGAVLVFLYAWGVNWNNDTVLPSLLAYIHLFLSAAYLSDRLWTFALGFVLLAIALYAAFCRVRKRKLWIQFVVTDILSAAGFLVCLDDWKDAPVIVLLYGLLLAGLHGWILFRRKKS